MPDCGSSERIGCELVVQLNPALTDFKGLTNFICYRWNFALANMKNEYKQIEEDFEFASIIG